MYRFLLDPRDYLSSDIKPIRRVLARLVNIVLISLLTFCVVGSAACAINLFIR